MLKKKIEKLINLIEDTQIEEIEISSFWGIQKIRLSKSKVYKNITPPISQEDKNHLEISKEMPEAANIPESTVEKPVELDELEELAVEQDNYEDESKFRIIKAPLVGTFYSSPKPEDPAFINLGENIETGKVVCIIEAMKIFNEIESEFSGKLVHTYIESGTPVEYGQELFVLRIDNV